MPPNRKTRSPESRTDQIIESALDVFGEYGLAGARLDEIARRAGVAKGTVYLYFASKDDLFRAVVRSAVVGPMRNLVEVEREGTVEERLESLLADFWAYVRGRSFQTVYRLVLGELNQFPELVEDYSKQVSGQVTGAIERLLEEGIAAGRFRELAPQPTARIIVGVFVQHAVWSERRKLFRQLEGREDEEVFAELVGFYSYAIRAPS